VEDSSFLAPVNDPFTDKPFVDLRSLSSTGVSCAAAFLDRKGFLNVAPYSSIFFPHPVHSGHMTPFPSFTDRDYLSVVSLRTNVSPWSVSRSFDPGFHPLSPERDFSLPPTVRDPL